MTHLDGLRCIREGIEAMMAGGKKRYVLAVAILVPVALPFATIANADWMDSIVRSTKDRVSNIAKDRIFIQEIVLSVSQRLPSRNGSILSIDIKFIEDTVYTIAIIEDRFMADNLKASVETREGLINIRMDKCKEMHDDNSDFVKTIFSNNYSIINLYLDKNMKILASLKINKENCVKM
ncbi:hypothetical protein D3C87_1289970 [compost metagenome]